jgi:hypothetical protein
VTKTTPPRPPPAPYVPTDYEQGVLDVLEVLKQEVFRLSDAHREAIRLLWDASPEAQSLLNLTNPAANLVGDVQNRVEKRARDLLNKRRSGV